MDKASSSAPSERRSHLRSLSIELLGKRFGQFALVQYKMFPLNLDAIKWAETLENEVGTDAFVSARKFMGTIRSKLNIKSMFLAYNFSNSLHS